MPTLNQQVYNVMQQASNKDDIPAEDPVCLTGYYNTWNVLRYTAQWNEQKQAQKG